MALLAWGPILLAFSIVVVPSGMAGIRVSEMSGTVPGTLYPGVHFVIPLVEDVALFDTRDQVFTTGVTEDGKNAAANVSSKSQLLDVQSKEGLTIGLAITVRYRLDPHRLDYIETRLPQPVDSQMVPAVVASAWRDLVPNYTVREISSVKARRSPPSGRSRHHEEARQRRHLVEEVMLRNIQLPPEYASGLQDLLLKEQQNDQMGVETDIQQKQVRIAELQAEARVRRKSKKPGRGPGPGR